MWGRGYRWVMKVAHKYNWHYAPPIYPDGNTQLWCKWCGFRETIKFKEEVSIINTLTDEQINSILEGDFE